MICIFQSVLRLPAAEELDTVCPAPDRNRAWRHVQRLLCCSSFIFSKGCEAYQFIVRLFFFFTCRLWASLIFISFLLPLHPHTFPQTLPYYCINPCPANVENMVTLLITSADGKWDLTRRLNFWRRNYFLLILAHPVYKMWIIQETNTLELWNKLHFEEEKNGEYIPCLKYSVPIFVE